MSRQFLPSLLITISIKPRWEVLGRFILDVSSLSSFTPPAGKPELFYCPDLAAQIYNQFANDFMKGLVENAKAMFGRRCIGIAAKLKFQAQSTPHHHIFLSLEGGVLEDVYEIDSMVSSKLLSEQNDSKLSGLVKQFSIHQHPPYCTGRTKNRQYRFGYDSKHIVQQTTIAETCSRLEYRRRSQ